jgi:hypothetical protein
VLNILPKLKWWRLAGALATGVFCLSSAVLEASGQNSGLKTGAGGLVGRIVGNIDGISFDGDQAFLSGWACQQGQKASILAHVFTGSATDPSKATFVVAGKANVYSEPAVAQACRDNAGGKHRFLIVLPFGHGQESTFFVHGIRVVDGVANDAIAGSGKPLVQLPGRTVPYPDGRQSEVTTGKNA